ncbi:MAG: LptF/LptG family permease [bacterium]|nr:LptF/LptG family permease [bacterium]
MRLIDRHLLTATAGPFLFGWFVITFLLMIDVLFRYVDLFVSKGVPFLLATRVLGLSLGYTFALSVPMAVLVGVLMGVGQLAADHEITAMKASGLSLWALARPLFVAAALITASQVAYNHYVYPRSNHVLVNLLQDIGRQKPMLEVREQQFTDLNEHLTIFVRRKDDLTGVIGDVTIVEKGQPGDLSPRLTIAERGRIVPDHENDLLRIELEDGEIHEVPDPEDPDTYQLTRFRRHNLVVENMEQDFQISERSARSDREMDLGELMAAATTEREHQDDVRGRVRELAGTVLDAQWRVMDDDYRTELGNARAGSQRPAAAVLENHFRSSRQKVERALEQDRYQSRLMESYRVKEAKYLVEYHKKFAIPVACVVFVLLGVPMAVAGSRSGRGISVSLALAVFLVYYAFLMGGEKLADRGRLDPVVAMWSANVVLTAIGIPLFMRTVREGRLPDLPAWPWRRRSAHPAATPGGAA